MRLIAGHGDNQMHRRSLALVSVHGLMVRTGVTESVSLAVSATGEVLGSRFFLGRMCWHGPGGERLYAWQVLGGSITMMPSPPGR